MGLLLFFFAISIIFSFLCSTWEAVLLSITPQYIEVERQKDTALSRRLTKFKENVDRPLAAILTLNTIAHTVGAIGVGSQVEDVYGDGMDFVIDLGFMMLPMTGEALVAFIMTLAILILSEIIPKTLGATYWQSLVGFTVNSLQVIIILLWPLVWLSQFITRLLKRNKDKSVLSYDEFAAMTEVGIREGIFEQRDSRIMRNLLRFSDLTAEDVMTPRNVVKMADANTPIEAFYEKNKELPFSRIPLYIDRPDNVVGYVLKDDVLTAIIEDQGDLPLKSLQRKLLMIKEDIGLADLFDKLMAEREHIALAIDQYGVMQGLVSTEDVIETLLGLEIVDETDSVADMQTLARKRWAERARRIGIIDADDDLPTE